jgi:hypothetical protein
MVSGLAIDLENRRRVKLYGRMVKGSLSDGDEGQAHCSRTQLWQVRDQLGFRLCRYDMLLIQVFGAVAKTVSSSHEATTMDTNIRGGPPGFMRVESNNASGAVRQNQPPGWFLDFLAFDRVYSPSTRDKQAQRRLHCYVCILIS